MCVCYWHMCPANISETSSAPADILSAAPADIYFHKKKTNTESWKGEIRLKEINYDR